MDMTKALNPQHLREGDKVILTGEDWTTYQQGLLRTIGGPSTEYTDGHRLLENAHSTYVVFVDGLQDYSATLVERNGKKVDAIAQYENGTRLLIQYTDGTVVGEDDVVYHAEANQPRNRARGTGWSLVYDSKANGIEDDQVNPEDIQALADELDLCSEFDQTMFRKFGWASREVTTPTIGQMRELAYENGYGRQFDRRFPKVEPEEDPYEAPKAPKKGENVVLTTGDGRERRGVVERVRYNEGTATFSHSYTKVNLEGAPYDSVYIFDTSDGVKEYDGPDRTVVKVEVLEREWKVGDTVPAGTTLKKEWIGVIDGEKPHWVARFATVLTGQASEYDRRISWIQE